jgi:hypothetical protein
LEENSAISLEEKETYGRTSKREKSKIGNILE